MSLSSLKIKNAKYGDKPYKLSDSGGMYLLVNKSGKYFRFDYPFQGKRKTLALGVYPEISLAEARQKHREARKLLNDRIDPVQYKKDIKSKLQAVVDNLFACIAREWFEKKKMCGQKITPRL